MSIDRAIHEVFSEDIRTSHGILIRSARELLRESKIDGDDRALTEGIAALFVLHKSEDPRNYSGDIARTAFMYRKHITATFGDDPMNEHGEIMLALLHEIEATFRASRANAPESEEG